MMTHGLRALCIFLFSSQDQTVSGHGSEGYLCKYKYRGVESQALLNVFVLVFAFCILIFAHSIQFFPLW